MTSQVTQFQCCENRVVCLPNPSHAARAPQPQRFLDGEQAHMNTCGCYGAPVTQRVSRTREPLPRPFLRNQLHLPPMRSLRHCLSSLGYAWHICCACLGPSSVESVDRSRVYVMGTTDSLATSCSASAVFTMRAYVRLWSFNRPRICFGSRRSAEDCSQARTGLLYQIFQIWCRCG